MPMNVMIRLFRSLSFILSPGYQTSCIRQQAAGSSMKVLSILAQTFLAFNPKSLSTQLNQLNPQEVRCVVSKEFPSVTPIEAREAWLNFTWTNGGDLPIIIQKVEHNGNVLRRRRLLPLLAEETLLEDDDVNVPMTADERLVMQYKLTEMGPFWKSEIKEDSHLGTLSFSPSSETGKLSDVGCKMIWNVTFVALKRQSFWEAVTQNTISDACNNLESFLAEPIKFTLSTDISTEAKPSVIEESWFDFIWRNGGGLPLPPALPLDERGFQRLLIPPFLKERIISRANKSDSEMGEIYYTVDNPGLIFLHNHLGRITFSSVEGEANDDKMEMLWEVAVTPKRGFEKFTKVFVETVVTILSINFKDHIEEKRKMVGVYLPRGGLVSDGKKEPLFQVRKDSWVGNVLDAHVRDTRNSFEQSLDLFRPLRWGTYFKEEGQSEDRWSNGEILCDEKMLKE